MNDRLTGSPGRPDEYASRAALSPIASNLGIVIETPNVEIDESRVWHYTDPSGLEGILANHVIWASSADKMNDPDELLVGGRTLLDLLAEAESSIDPAVVDAVAHMVLGITRNHRHGAYLASSCWHSDSPTMWTQYAGTKGYAVVLDAADPLFIRRQSALTPEMVEASGLLGPSDGKRIEEWAESTPKIPWRWRGVVYTVSDQEAALREGLIALEEAARLTRAGRPAIRGELEVMADLANMLDIIKHEGYVDEREKRILCMTMPGAEAPFVRQRGSSGQVINYVELGVPQDPTTDLLDGEPEAMGRLPIVGVVVGPDADPDYAVNLLRVHGYEHVPVSHSGIVYGAERAK